MSYWDWLAVMTASVTATFFTLSFVYSNIEAKKKKYFILSIISFFVMILILLPKPLQQLNMQKNKPFIIKGQSVINPDPLENVHLKANFSPELEVAKKEIKVTDEAKDQISQFKVDYKKGTDDAPATISNYDDKFNIKQSTFEDDANEDTAFSDVIYGEIKDYANLRNFQDSRVIKVLPPVTGVELLSNYNSNNMVKVRVIHSGEEGWVFGSFIRLIK